MEKNWERSANVFSDKLVFGAGHVYHNQSFVFQFYDVAEVAIVHKMI
jgi:hypothetical protein